MENRILLLNAQLLSKVADKAFTLCINNRELGVKPFFKQI